MINLAVFLAEIDEEILKQGATQGGLHHSTHETIFLFAVLLAMTLALFFCAYVMYRKRRHGLSRSPYPPSLTKNEVGEKAGATPAARRRRKWRRRRREHRPRNPTLAETGGLPPIRSEDQPPSAP